MTRSEVKQRLQKVEHALEVVALQKPMSEVNAQHADAVNTDVNDVPVARWPRNGAYPPGPGPKVRDQTCRPS
ncbi:hypothetical protein BS329_21100 [Amycolatopsis coloradensis]|uniref:Uncharacterized protein n=2 Tax=Amycolatopsis coloradensis TaxID=76021 RepID=A0A1R0KR52_9PSEU|nr:hypothetical protein BS329_21100 [Amycolatopsis coloradensis]